MENFPKFMADTKPQIQEAQRTENRINIKRYTQLYQSQTAENQRQLENLERSQEIRKQRNTLSMEEQE